MLLRRVLVSPDGRQKLELSGPREGLYGFRLWQRTGKVWRLEAKVYEFATYSRSVYEAFQRVSWLGRALGPTEHLRGNTFRFSEYREDRFGDHDHCTHCWQKVAERDWPDVQHQGYVTRYAFDRGSEAQWNWICERCFADFRSEMQWSIDDSPWPSRDNERE